MKRFIHRLLSLAALLLGALFAGGVFAGVIEVRVNDGVPGSWQEATTIDQDGRPPCGVAPHEERPLTKVCANSV